MRYPNTGVLIANNKPATKYVCILHKHLIIVA